MKKDRILKKLQKGFKKSKSPPFKKMPKLQKKRK